MDGSFVPDAEQPRTLVDIFDRLAAEADGDRVEMGSLLDAFGRRTFGPMLFVPGFIALAPTGAIPGMSIITGSLIILVAVQMLLPTGQPWLPKRLRRFAFDREPFEKALAKSRPWVKKLDRLFRPRLRMFAAPPVSHLVALVCIAAAVSMFPLALIPFAVAVPAAAVVMLSLGLVTQDGLLVLIGFAFAFAGILLVVSLIG